MSEAQVCCPGYGVVGQCCATKMPMKAAKTLLNYSLKDINYSYDTLTGSERALVTKEEFNELVKWVGTVPTWVRTRLAYVPEPEPACKECGGFGFYIIGSSESDEGDDAEAKAKGEQPDTWGMVTECDSCARFNTGREAADFLRDWLDENEAVDAELYRGRKKA